MPPSQLEEARMSPTNPEQTEIFRIRAAMRDAELQSQTTDIPLSRKRDPLVAEAIPAHAFRPGESP